VNAAAYLVNWAEARKCFAGATPWDTWVEEVEKENPWAKSVEFFPASLVQYTSVGEAWQAMRGSEEIPPTIDEAAQIFMNHLITDEDFRTDLGDNGEFFALSISPETAAELARASAKVDFSIYREVYYSNCDPSTLECLSEYTESGDVDQSFEESFLPYVTMWVETVAQAVKEGKGLLVQMS
jgi:hypothetical protein